MIALFISAVVATFRNLDLKVSDNDSTVSIDRILRDMNIALNQLRSISFRAQEVFRYGRELMNGELINSFDDSFEKETEIERRGKIQRDTQELWTLFVILSLLISKLNDVALHARMSDKAFRSLVAKAFKLAPIEQSKLTSEANVSGLMNIDGVFMGLHVLDLTCYLIIKFEGITQILGNNIQDDNYITSCQESAFERISNDKEMYELLQKCNHVFAVMGNLLDFEARSHERPQPGKGKDIGSRSLGGA